MPEKPFFYPVGIIGNLCNFTSYFRLVIFREKHRKNDAELFSIFSLPLAYNRLSPMARTEVSLGSKTWELD